MKGKYGAYMFRLGGPKSENVEKPLVLYVFLRVKGATIILKEFCN